MTRQSFAGAVALSACALAMACSDGGGRPVTVAVHTPPPASGSAAAEAPWPPRMRLSAVAAPGKLVVDGKLGEWGDLDAGAVEVPEPESPFPRVGPLGQGDIAPEIENAPSPKEADLRVGLAVVPEGVIVAIDFGNTGLEELTIGLASIPPRADGLVYLQSEGDTSPSPPPDPVRVVSAPEAGAFTSELHITKEGAARKGAAGARALAGAEVRYDASAHTLEAKLPNAALPELTEAPLVYLRAAVAVSGPLPGDVLKAPWRWIALASEVAYAPWADLRARILRDVQMLGPAGGAGLSYHPDQPLRIASADRKPGGYGPLQPMGTLFEKKASLGDVEVGLGFANIPYVATVKGGQLRGTHLMTFHNAKEDEGGSKQGALTDGTVKGIVERGGEIHIITWADTAYLTQITGEVVPGHWTVVRVDREGAIRSDRCFGDLPFDALYQLGTLSPYADEKLTKLGWKQGARDGVRAADLLTLECVWDEKKKAYRDTLKGKLPGR